MLKINNFISEKTKRDRQKEWEERNRDRQELKGRKMNEVAS